MSRLITGTLPIGVEVDGVVHREFSFRGSTVGDNIEVTEELDAAGEAPTPLRLGTAMMARQLVTLGTLKREQITTALVRGLHTADWNHLDRLSEDQEKKLLCDGPTPSQAGGSTPAPGPSDTASSPTS
jgi:hypothetical protein